VIVAPSLPLTARALTDNIEIPQEAILTILNRGGKWWRVGRRVGPMAMIAIPWFFRDQVAAELDKHSLQLQQALTEQVNQEQREAQNKDQRQAMHLLQTIRQAQLGTDDTEQDALDKQSKDDDIVALSKSAQQFISLEERTKNEGGANPAKLDLANPAIEIYKELEAAKWKPDQALEKQWENEEGWSKIEANLGEAFDELSDAAKKEVEQSTKGATFWRFMAWAFTALGGLLIGDWKTLLAGPNAGGDEPQTDTTDASE
jgi:hypothetical protein